MLFNPREKIKTTGEELADPNVKLAIEMKREEDDMVKYVFLFFLICWNFTPGEIAFIFLTADSI